MRKVSHLVWTEVSIWLRAFPTATRLLSHWNCDTDTAEREYNAILSPADTTFTVEGLDEWVTALDQIGQEDWDSLVADGKAALSQREGDCITGADCLGGYMLVRQDFSSEMVETHNILYVAYKVQAQLPDGVRSLIMPASASVTLCSTVTARLT